ncbi:hypothetical protein GF371_03095 [Candidatus Woesearchaeota archaeon]|nr:hypothetical protein [Candidatus Woesearchaeota archaeon]
MAMDDISKLKLDILKSYIKELRSQGYGVNEIKASLIKNGAPRNLVNAAIKQMPKTVPKKPAKKPKIKYKPETKPKKIKKFKPVKPFKKERLEEQIIEKAETLEGKKARKSKKTEKHKKPEKKRLFPSFKPQKRKPVKKPAKPAKPSKSVKPTKPSKPAGKKVRMTPKHKHHVTWYVLVVVIVALLGLLYFFMMPANCGEDSACFIAYANDCENAVMSKTLGTAVFKFRTNDCVLEKEIIGFSEAEPDAVKNLFTGLKMECSYEEGKFDVNFINSLAGGIDKCGGELKDTILEVRRTAKT